MRCFGLIPLPLILGSLLDKSCLLWEKVCNKDGSCRLYDNDVMSNSMTILLVCAKVRLAVDFICHYIFITTFLLNWGASLQKFKSDLKKSIGNDSTGRIIRTAWWRISLGFSLIWGEISRMFICHGGDCQLGGNWLAGQPSLLGMLTQTERWGVAISWL